MTEYRIEFSIQRRLDDNISSEEDFTEIGFGSSSAWDDLDSAVYAVTSSVQNGEWETENGMPSPEDVVAAIRAARVDESEAGS